MVIAAPFRKSRRGMARSIPSSRSVRWLGFSFFIFFLRLMFGQMKNQSGGTQFFHRSPGLIHGLIGIRGSSRVRIGDCDSSEALAADFAGTLALRPLRIEQVIVFVGVSMRPAIDSDCRNIVCRVEPAIAQDARELVANTSLKHFKGRRQQI